MHRCLPLTIVAAIALGACSQSDAQSTPKSKAPAAKVVGEAVNCIPIAQISSSTVHDDQTIDFKVGSKLYRNTLPNSCPGLGMEGGFSYKTSQSELCNVDIIHVLDRTGGHLREGVGCGLGKFVPIELEKKK